MLRVGTFIALFLVGLVLSYFLVNYMGSPQPPVATDLVGKLVTLPDSNNPGSFVGWIIDGKHSYRTDLLEVKQVGHGRTIVYVDLADFTVDGSGITGIAELHYLKIRDKSYLVSINSVNLTLFEAAEPLPPKEPETIKKALPLPGKS